MMEPTEGGDSILLSLPEHIFRTIVQYLKVAEKKNLRLSSASMKRRLQDNDKTFLHWKFENITPEQLKQLADDIEMIEELTVGAAFTLFGAGTEDAVTCDEAVKYVIEKHPEMTAIFIKEHFSITDKGLQAILCAENMVIVEIDSGKIRGTELNPQAHYSKNIQSLTLKCFCLFDKGLIQILQCCGTGLKSLAIPTAHISGEGLHALKGKLINLEKLDLSFCRNFTNQGMREMLQICGNELKSLDLSSSGISATQLRELLKICGTGLKTLSIHHLNLSGDGFHALQGKLINIELLDMKWCEDINRLSMIKILQMCGTQLKALDLSYTEFTGEGLSVLQGKFVNLETLKLGVCRDITKQGMKDILQMCGTKLKVLDLHGTKITDEYLAGFKGKLINLETLTLVNCKDITQQGILGLLQLCGTQLKVLDLSQTHVDGEGMSVLKDKFMNLETLELKLCDSITDQGVVELLQMCGTKLKVLDLSPADVSGEGLSVFKGKFIDLETLCIAGCEEISQQGLLALLEMCGTQLKELYLCNTNVTGEGLSVLQGKFMRLETLNLSCWAGFSDLDLIMLVDMCGTGLKVLDLEETTITCEGLSALEGKLVNLETLNLGFCEDITEQGMMELLQICGAGLQSLILGDPMEGIPDSILAIAEQAKSTHPKLKISEP